LTTGKATFDTIWEKCRIFAATLEPMLGPALEPLTVDVTHNKVHLHAVIENCRGGIHLRWRCAAMKGKDRLSLWIEHLLLNIARVDGYPIQSKMVASDMALELPPVDNAAEVLGDLLDIYCEGMKSPLRFFPETSWFFQSDGQQKADAAWRGDSWRGFSGECDNQAITLCFDGKEPWGDEFRSLAERIYAPIIAAKT
jgi:exodeoxyribonuclease V gamma subunit